MQIADQLLADGFLVGRHSPAHRRFQGEHLVCGSLFIAELPKKPSSLWQNELSNFAREDLREMYEVI